MIITLCGSARFEHIFKAWNEVLTLHGHTVFSLAVYPSDKKDTKLWYTDEQKRMLDIAHKRKILASEAILVLNKAGYVGPSTLSEIEFAEVTQKAIYYREEWALGEELNDQALADKYGIELPYKSPIDTTKILGQRDRGYDLLKWHGTDARTSIEYLKGLDA